MHLTLLSRGRDVPSTRRLVEAAKARGHRVAVLPPEGFALLLGGRQPGLLHEGKPCPKTDIVIPRFAAVRNTLGMAALDLHERRGIPSLNGSSAIGLVRSRALCLAALHAAGVPLPRTLLADSAESLTSLVARVGRGPVVVKLADATRGRTVLVCESAQSLRAAVEALFSLGQELLVQRAPVAGRGRDLRVLVVGGEVVAACERRRAAGPMLRTLRQGAKPKRVKLSPEATRWAVESTAAVGLDVAGVDLFEGERGVEVVELSASPNLVELEEVTGRDLASELIARAEWLADPAVQRRLPAPPAPVASKRRKKTPTSRR